MYTNAVKPFKWFSLHRVTMDPNKNTKKKHFDPPDSTPIPYTRVYPKITSNLVRAAESKLYDFISSKKEIIEIYSCRGIFEIDNSKVYKVKHANGPTAQINIRDIAMVVDKSSITRTPEFQFPRSHTSRNVIRTTYKIAKKSTVKFVTESCDDGDDPYMDYYFITDNYEQKNHQMDIIEFLNMIGC